MYTARECRFPFSKNDFLLYYIVEKENFYETAVIEVITGRTMLVHLQKKNIREKLQVYCYMADNG